jgi:hypothetical protein
LLPHDGIEPQLAKPPGDKPQPALCTPRLNGGIRNGERDEYPPRRGEAMQEASEALAGTVTELRHLAPLAAAMWRSRARQVTVGYDQSPLRYELEPAIMFYGHGCTPCVLGDGRRSPPAALYLPLILAKTPKIVKRRPL